MSSQNPLPIIQNQNDAINVLVSAVQVAQKRGAFSLPEAEVISMAVKQFTIKKDGDGDGDDVQKETVQETVQETEQESIQERIQDDNDVLTI